MLEKLKLFLYKHSTILTGIVAAYVLFAGIAVVNHPETWWIAVLGLLCLTSIVTVFAIARVIYKATGTFLILFFSMMVAAKVGGVSPDGFTFAGTINALLMLSLFFLLLAASYIWETQRNRWMVLALSLVVADAALIVGLMLSENQWVGLVLTQTFFVSVFVSVYFFLSVRDKKQKNNTTTKIIADKTLKIKRKPLFTQTAKSK